MKKEIKLTYLKKAAKFLLKHPSVITEDEVDALVIKFIKRNHPIKNSLNKANSL